MSVNWAQIRAEFPALSDWTYLNSATFGQLSKRTRAAVEDHFAHRDEQACSDFMGWFDDADRVRASIARLVNCQPGDIAFIGNASQALSLLMSGIDWQPGDRVVTFENEFPNHYYFPSQLGKRGVEFVETGFESFYDAITPRTRVVVMSTVSYATGFRAPLEEIGRFLRERGVLLYVDGTQSTGALRFDVASVQPDMFAVHGYKWLLSPNGSAFMYVSPGLRERLEPQVIGWRSDQGWRRPDQLHHGVPQFKTEAERYEGGMLSFPSVYAMGAAVDFFLELGPEVIEQRVLDLADRTRAVLREAGASVLSDSLPYHDSQIVCARFPGREASLLAAELRQKRVLVAARRGYLRVSPHFYNDESDLARLAAALG